MTSSRGGALPVIQPDACEERVRDVDNRRPANALNVEPIQPLPRCRFKTPEHWGKADPRASRWLLSGGSTMVLGMCDVNACPRMKSP